MYLWADTLRRLTPGMSKRWAPPKDRSIEFQTRYVTDTLSDARLA